ncbi:MULTISPECIES: carbonic anhydrase [unclassified Neptuniibacter]|uniref:carbonic anhydrase n=1 Tax=unclassified Neptuniibacter TaxID=2630693 RepID=UPI000C455BE3|nr:MULTISPECIES: carbonic anhydrase [unclassified Neptuniibacter]MAY41505.1 carbonic anhydrase [Oceanospirillaceae bacterium]|tara:strand:+ start:9917 stop:10591 length:675 start_codon:yes stop_codon:yes gene_type:complete
MDKIIQGVLDFKKNVYPERKDLFGVLVDQGQSPEVLFITCSDSRIDPNLLTGSHPGDIFICRNAGNIIPPHMNQTGGMTASIEFAVAVLGVRHIIVCGHTDCGAVKGALDLESVKGLPHVKEWLGHCRSAMEIVRERNDIAGDQPVPTCHLDEAIEENVLQQVQHLRTHPVVAAKLATNKIEIHGWVYDIKSGTIRCSRGNDNEFSDFNALYAGIISKLSGQDK